jgi:septum formation protein
MKGRRSPHPNPSPQGGRGPEQRIPQPRARLVLASSSPQRQALLKRAGLTFELAHPGEAENAIAAAPTPDALAIAKARAKAQGVAAALPGPYPAIVIGADTLVVSDAGELIGKPLDRVEAVEILSRLLGSRHCVISGVCLWPVNPTPFPSPQGGEGLGVGFGPKLAAVRTWVTMRRMSAREIETYVASGEADGKAGAYAIQEEGERFVKTLEGSFSNVVGFPLERFAEMLAEVEAEWRL